MKFNNKFEFNPKVISFFWDSHLVCYVKIHGLISFFDTCKKSFKGEKKWKSCACLMTGSVLSHQELGIKTSYQSILWFINTQEVSHKSYYLNQITFITFFLVEMTRFLVCLTWFSLSFRYWIGISPHWGSQIPPTISYD